MKRSIAILLFGIALAANAAPPVPKGQPGHKVTEQDIANEANLNGPQISGQMVPIRRIDRRTRDADQRYRALENRYIVLFKNGARHTEQQMLDKIRTRGGGTVHYSYAHERGINGFAATLSPAVVQQFASDATVALIEEDRVASGLALPLPASPQTTVFSGGALPWALDRIDQSGLAGTVTLNNLFNFPLSGGAGIHIYIVDEGIKGGSLGQVGTGAHQELDGRMGAGADFIDPSTNADDCFAFTSVGHGTFAASLAAGTTVGVAKLATVHPVRVLDCGEGGSSSTVIAGVNFVTSDHLAHPGQKSIANLSLTVGVADPAVDAAVQNSINNGVVYTIAAGNSAGRTDIVTGIDLGNSCNLSPQRVGSAITVGAAVDVAPVFDSIAEFSDTGGCVDLYAPGSLMTGATAHGVNTYSGAPFDNQRHFGTSWAAPMVAGAVALLWNANPAMNGPTVASTLISNAPDNALFENANFEGGSKRLLYTGFPTNVQVGLTSNQGAPPAGSVMVYTIQIKNNGPLATLDPVQFVDTLPADVSLNSMAVTGPTSCTGTTTITCDLGKMAVGQQAVITLNVTVPQTIEPFTNSAVATLVGQVNSNGANGQASLTLATH